MRVSDLPNPRCAGMDPDVFYPDFRLEQAETIHAKTICAGCPDQTACLVYAMAAGGEPEHGVFGGTSARFRRRFAAAGPKEAWRLLSANRRVLRGFAEADVPWSGRVTPVVPVAG